LKILQLIDSLHSGGAERMCVNISNVLHDNGHEVTLCATRTGGALEKAINSSIRFHVLHKKSSLDFVAFRRLLRIIKDNGIETIHAHSSSLFWAIMAKVFYGKVKVLWHDHNGLRVSDFWKNLFYKLLSVKTDGIIAVNHELAAWSRHNMKVLPERIVMINNFPFLKSVERHPNPEFFTIVCLANIRPQKDHETLIRAIALLKKKDLPKEIKVIFAGSLDDKVYSQRMIRMIAEFSLEDTIEMPGTVEYTSSLLAGSDCGVLSSSSEGLPVSLLEYGMAALPVVVTNVGKCAEVVGNGRYGKVVSTSDVQGLAEELFWIFSNPDEAKIVGENLKKHVGNNYGPGNFLTDYMNLLNLIIRQ